MEPIDDEMLDSFVDQRYHWKTLTPVNQMKIAVELKKLRYINNKMYGFIAETLDDKAVCREYRRLLIEGDKD
jgi:hypothetical protein